MTMKDEALRLALETLEYPGPSWLEARQPAITACKQALAQPEPETYWRDMAFAHLGGSRDKMPDEQVTAVQDWLHGVYTSRPKAKDEKGRPMTYWGGMEQPEPEPVAIAEGKELYWIAGREPIDDHDRFLYTSPPKREWQGLTDEQKMALCKQFPDHLTFNAIEAIEAKLKEKNSA